MRHFGRIHPLGTLQLSFERVQLFLPLDAVSLRELQQGSQSPTILVGNGVSHIAVSLIM